MPKVHDLARRSAIQWVFAWLSVPALAAAATWHVSYDPAHPEDRVGAIVAQAASGDSVLIDPGTYYEHIPLEGKSLTFIGVSGSGATTLDGSRPLPGRQGSIIYTLSGTARELALDGLTLRGGTGAPLAESFNSIGGGAILWWAANTGDVASITAIDCALEGNTTGAPDYADAVGGGAILARGLDEVRLERCTFAGNTTLGSGGDLLLTSSINTISSCSFHITEGGSSGGASIHLQEGGTLEILGCTFESSEGDGRRPSIHAEGRSVEILDSRFVDRGPGIATRIELGFGGVGNPRQDVLISRNLFWNAAGTDTTNTLLIGLPNGAITISENTLVRCGMNLQNDAGSAPAVFERNVVARAEVTYFLGGGGQVRCNDFWSCSVEDRFSNLEFSGGINLDPLFCGEAGGDFSIAVQSPCTAEHAPEGCGRIGAFDSACDLSPTRRVSWGQIRGLFR